MISQEARISIANAYANGKLLKVIAYENGISPSYAGQCARGLGVKPRQPRREPPPRDSYDAEALRLFRAGLDTVSIAVRLVVSPADAANAVARARDAERGQ